MFKLEHQYIRPARGQRCIYHVGSLYIGSLTGSFEEDETGKRFAVQDPRSAAAAPRAMAAWQDKMDGKVILVQRRLAENNYEFIAIGL
jgi:hypothetical protein